MQMFPRLSHGDQRTLSLPGFGLSLALRRALVTSWDPRPGKGGLYSPLSSVLTPSFLSPIRAVTLLRLEYITFLLLRELKKRLKTHILYFCLFLVCTGMAGAAGP